MPVKAVIAEDEPHLREQLRKMLGVAWPDLSIAAVAADGLEAIRAIELHAPQVLFLDIHMPEASGVEVARAANGRCHVVFVTAYDQYAVTAFEEGVVDYVMKPFSAAHISRAVQRVKDRLHLPPQGMESILAALSGRLTAAGGYLRWLNVSRGTEVELVTTDEVQYFQSDTKYTRVVTVGAEGLIRKTIRELAAELDPRVFWQVHRSTIVNLNAVQVVSRDLAGHVVLKLRDRREALQVSQAFAHLFRQM